MSKLTILVCDNCAPDDDNQVVPATERITVHRMTDGKKVKLDLCDGCATTVGWMFNGSSSTTESTGRASNGSVQDAVWGVVSSASGSKKQWTANKVAEATGLTRKQTASTMANLTKAGYMKKVSRGVYQAK